jgi:trans-aconitate 2-methyltransferase
MTTRSADWDASRYHRVAQPHAAWGASVLERLELSGEEVVLDAGCGSGRVTAQLLERLPRGHVIAADASPAMLDEARTTLSAFGDQVTYLQTDLLDIDTNMPQKVDVVFSTAVFHWIADHPRLFRALHTVLKPGGRLIAQCGGGNNLLGFMHATDAVVVREPFAQHLLGKDLWRFYYSPEQTEANLLAAGFERAEAWLEPSPQTFASKAALADFARGVVLSSHVAALPEALRNQFVDKVVDQIASRNAGAYQLDYVRLNMAAFAWPQTAARTSTQHETLV